MNCVRQVDKDFAIVKVNILNSIMFVRYIIQIENNLLKDITYFICYFKYSLIPRNVNMVINLLLLTKAHSTYVKSPIFSFWRISKLSPCRRFKCLASALLSSNVTRQMKQDFFTDKYSVPKILFIVNTYWKQSLFISSNSFAAVKIEIIMKNSY